MARLLICPVRQGAEAFPHRPAVYLDAQALDYRTLDARLNALQHQLRAHGLEPGQHLVAAAANSLPLLLLAWAALREGLVFCPLNPALPLARQQMLARRLEARAFWSADTVPDGTWQALTLDFDQQIGVAAPCELDPDRPSDLILTSGSSGEPKAVAHSLANHLASAAGSRRHIPLGPGDRWLLSLPLYHVGGYAIPFRCFLAGAALVVPVQPQPLAKRLLATPITHLSLVPTQLHRLLAEPDFRLADTRIRCLLLGGAPIPTHLVAACQAQGLTPLVSYGLSEMASQVCTAAADDRPGKVGRPLPGREVRLEADGEICVRGQTLFLGYYRDGRIWPAVDAAGWFHTRDRGSWTEQGELVVQGRLDNQFISGGENIQPEEIEQQLLQHPAVAQALVVPVSDAEWGQRPAAFIRWQAPAPDFEALEQWLRRRLPGYLIPRRWLPWPEGPETDLKPSRQAFTRLAAGSAGS